MPALWIACSSRTTTSTSAPTSGKYSEDLSVWRATPAKIDTARKTVSTTGTVTKTPYVEAKFADNEKLDAILDSISEVNLAMGLVDGFTIQVYSGVQREEALNVKKEMSQSLPDIDAEIQYVQPNFRVRVGKYYDRFEALRDYQLIKRYFPNAVVLPERIPIR